MMKYIKILTLIVALAFVSTAGTAFAQDPPEPDQISTFTILSDPAPAGSTVTISINATITTADATTAFCLYSPTTASALGGANPAESPASFVLTYYTGFAPTTATFALAAQPDGTFGSCPARTGQNASLYKTTAASTVAGTTYTGSATWTIDSGATAGPYNWTLLLAEPTGSPNPLSYNHTIQAAVTDVYASDQADCGGYGIAGTSCFQSLQTAISTVTTGNDVIIVGDLTSDVGGATTNTFNVGTIRGISTPRLVAHGACATDTLLTLDGSVSTAGVSVSGITIDGTSCSGAATGISATSADANTIDSVTVQNFSAGTGVSVSGTGAVAVTNSTFSSNTTGVSDTTSGTVSIGSSPSTGNTFSSNTTGILSNGATIHGNTITGGTTGMSLSGSSAASIYGNSATGASSANINCTDSGTGAAFNYVGGVSATTGFTACSDGANQLGAAWSSWADGVTTLNEATTTAAAAIFDLGLNAPFGVNSDTTGLTSNFYAVMGNGTVTINGVAPSFAMVAASCLSPSTSACWIKSGDVGFSTAAPNHFVSGTASPTAITLVNFSANSSTNWLPVALIMGALVVVGGGLVVVRKNKQQA